MRYLTTTSAGRNCLRLNLSVPAVFGSGTALRYAFTVSTVSADLSSVFAASPEEGLSIVAEFFEVSISCTEFVVSPFTYLNVMVSPSL